MVSASVSGCRSARWKATATAATIAWSHRIVLGTIPTTQALQPTTPRSPWRLSQHHTISPPFDTRLSRSNDRDRVGDCRTHGRPIVTLFGGSSTTTTTTITACEGAVRTMVQSSDVTTGQDVTEQLVSSSSQLLPPPPVLGGDFAGLTATFDARTGRLQPVPDYLVPKDLLEWGQAPMALETLVSEDQGSGSIMTEATTTGIASESSSSEETSMTTRWNRQSTTILPATGCGVDNLETNKAVEKYNSTTTTNSNHDDADHDQDHSHSHPAWYALQRQTPLGSDRTRLRLDTCFGLVVDPDQPDDDVYRTRVTVDLARHTASNNNIKNDNDGWTLQSPIRIAVERRITSVTSRGTVADGGGLDGRRVYDWLGPYLSRGAAPHQWFGNDGDDDDNTATKDSAAVSMANRWTVTYGVLQDAADHDDSRKNTVFVDVGHQDPTTGHSVVVRHVLDEVD